LQVDKFGLLRGDDEIVIASDVFRQKKILPTSMNNL